MQQELEHKQWTGKTDGNRWMQRTLVVCFRYMPLWMCYSALLVAVPWYMLFSRAGYKACFRFFRTAFGYGRLRSFYYVALNHFRFGQVIIDRFAKYAGKQFKFINNDEQIFLYLSDRDESFVMLSAHIGSYEMAGYALHTPNKVVNALVFAAEAATVMENRQNQFSNNDVRMIPVTDDMSHLFMINNALRQGEIVSIPADRLHGSPKGVECEFFGRKAMLPMGPFATIAQRDVQAIAVFVLKCGYRTYDIRIFRLNDDIPAEAKRAEKIALTAQNFANAMQSVIEQYPTQWFNYYDFWK